MTTAKERTFSFACFPAERIIILTGIFAGPAVSIALLSQYRGVLETAHGNPNMTVSSQAASNLLPGLTLIASLILIVFGVFYLQYRAGTRVILNDDGFRYERKPALPFGWLARSIERSWSDVLNADFRQRLSLSGRRPELVLEWSGGRLVLSVADAWEEGSAKRPWFPKPPDNPSGWRAHPLVENTLKKISRE